MDLQDLQDSLDCPDLLVAQVLKETEDYREHLAVSAHLVLLVLKVLQDSPERKETRVRPLQSPA